MVRLRFVFALALVLGANGARGDAVVEEAKRHYQRGMAHFLLEQYDRAITEFQAGYLARPDAVLLYNIAQSFRLSHQPDRALQYYTKYLAEAPNAPNRDEVLTWIDDLSRLINEREKLEAGKPVTAISPEVAAPERSNPVRSVPSARSVAPAKPATQEQAPVVRRTKPDLAVQARPVRQPHSAPEAKPWHQKWWVWTVAAVVVGGAVATTIGVAAGSGPSEHVLPPVCDPMRPGCPGQ